MNQNHQQAVTSSFASKGTSQSQESYGDMTSTAKDTAEKYDAQYTELCYILEHVVTTVDYIKQYRMTIINALRNDLQQLLNSVVEARTSAADTDALKQYHEDAKRLECEKKQILKELLNDKDEEKDLRSKLQLLERHMDSIRHDNETVKNRSENALPSLEYMKKLLHRLSQVYLTSREDSRITQGYVSKKSVNDVRPFRYDESTTTHFDQVNDLWDIISEECC